MTELFAGYHLSTLEDSINEFERDHSERYVFGPVQIAVTWNTEDNEPFYVLALPYRTKADDNETYRY